MLIHLTNNMKMIICILNHCIKRLEWERSGIKWKCSLDRKINFVGRAKLRVIPPARKGHQRKSLE